MPYNSHEVLQKISNSYVNFLLCVTVCNNDLYLVQETFLHQNIEIFKRTLKAEKRSRWLKLNENEVTQPMWNHKCYAVR